MMQLQQIAAFVHAVTGIIKWSIINLFLCKLTQVLCKLCSCILSYNTAPQIVSVGSNFIDKSNLHLQIPL